MIRVYYQHQNPEGGYYEAEHSRPVADMDGFVFRINHDGPGISEIAVTRVETIELRPPTKGEEEFYARWGTAGEF